MNISATKLFAKILVLPALFTFALACCQPMFVQAAEATASHSDELTSEVDHDCDDNDHHEQSAVQALTQKLAPDFAFSNVVTSPASFYHSSTIDSHFLTQPRITGPPWDGKNIKAYLGVYRS